jgi:hypothetical protein
VKEERQRAILEPFWSVLKRAMDAHYGEPPSQAAESNSTAI